MAEPGSIIRTKTVRSYQCTAGEVTNGVSLVYQDLAPPKGMHGIVMALGMLDEGESIDQAWLFSRFSQLGWEPVPEHPVRKQWDEWKEKA